jgi:DNA polymerase III epsilon subunit-like protein
MIHLNGNLIASIDVETTGFIPGYHDIIQICVLILDSNLRPDKRVMPFYLDLKPKRPENIDQQALHISRINFARLMQRAIDPWDAADLFDEWFEKLKKDTPKRRALLPEGKKLIPLAQNWVFDRGFIIDWLGEKSFDSFLHPWYRDTLPVAQYINDSYAKDVHCVLEHKVPFPKSNLLYLCACLKIKNENPHDALGDAVATAEVYRKMVLRQLT